MKNIKSKLRKIFTENINKYNTLTLNNYHNLGIELTCRFNGPFFNIKKNSYGIANIIKHEYDDYILMVKYKDKNLPILPIISSLSNLNNEKITNELFSQTSGYVLSTNRVDYSNGLHINELIDIYEMLLKTNYGDIINIYDNYSLYLSYCSSDLYKFLFMDQNKNSYNNYVLNYASHRYIDYITAIKLNEHLLDYMIFLNEYYDGLFDVSSNIIENHSHLNLPSLYLVLSYYALFINNKHRLEPILPFNKYGDLRDLPYIITDKNIFDKLHFPTNLEKMEFKYIY